MKKILLIIYLSFAVSTWSLAQQTCLTSQTITAGSLTIPAINGTEVPAAVCATGGGGATAANWYKYTPTQDYSVTVTTDFLSNGNVDNRVHIFAGPCGSVSCVAGDDDSGTNALCVVSFNALANNDYYIVFDNKFSSLGFMFELIENEIVLPDSNLVVFTPVGISTLTGSTMALVDMNGDFLDDIVSVSATNIQVHQQNINAPFTINNYATTAIGEIISDFIEKKRDTEKNNNDGDNKSTII
jgi:hypothetical protein